MIRCSHRSAPPRRRRRRFRRAPCRPGLRAAWPPGQPPTDRCGRRPARRRRSARSRAAAPAHSRPPAARPRARARRRRRSPFPRRASSVSSAVVTSARSSRRRDADGGAGRERHDADAELLGHLVQERLRCDTGSVETGRLDVRRLHRPRDVEREHDGRFLARNAHRGVRTRDADDHEHERDEQRQRREVSQPSRAAVDDVRKQVGIAELRLRSDAPAIAVDVERNQHREAPRAPRARAASRTSRAAPAQERDERAEPVAGRREHDVPDAGRRAATVPAVRAPPLRRRRTARAGVGCACRPAAAYRSPGSTR